MDGQPTLGQIDARFTKLERQMAQLFEHLGLPADDGTDGVPSEVVALARDGKQMQAMKRYMELTGTDMNAAQRIVGGI